MASSPTHNSWMVFILEVKGMIYESKSKLALRSVCQRMERIRGRIQDDGHALVH